MKSLIICRHAKSDWSYNLPDFERPLNARGKKDAPAMGEFLLNSGFETDLIISSPAVRALTTAQAIAKAIKYPGKIQTDERFYESGHGAALSVIQETPDQVETLMVFGHNPTWEMLANFLLQSPGAVTMPTCGMISFSCPVVCWKDLGSRACSLNWFLIPRIVRGESG